MFRHLYVILFILLAGIFAFLTDITYGQASDIRAPVSYLNNQPAAPMQYDSLDYDPSEATFDSVHVWQSSKCGLCHLADDPYVEPMLFVVSDQSLLCESCHQSKVTVLSDNGFRNVPHYLNNHPIKFSPFDFDSDKINQNIIRKNGSFYLSGATGEVPLFGDTEDTAVAECSTCHDPHGRTTVPLLGRFDNTEGELCMVCHINISVGMK